MMPRVAVMGGSVGGLTAALVLRDAGCDVTVFERSSAALQARGAGIAALEATLRYLTERGGRQVADVCSSTNWIRFLRADGGVRLVNFVWYVNVAEGGELDELMTGWDGIHRAVSLPPGAARPSAVAAMRQAAAGELAPSIAEVVTGVAEPFVQVVYDIAVPRMAFGR